MPQPPRNLFLALALLCAGAPDARAQAPEPEAPTIGRYDWQGPASEIHREIGVILREARRAGPETGRLAVRLSARGPAALGPLLDVLAQGRVPKGAETDAGQTLSKPQRALVLSALARLPAKALRAELDARLVASKEPGLRLAAVHVLGTIGTGGDLARLRTLVPREEDGSLTSDGREALRAACSSIFRRSFGALEDAARQLRQKDPQAGREILFALGDLREKHAVKLLFEVARSDRDLAQLAIALVRQTGRSGDPDIDRQFSLWLREAIDPRKTEWTRTVVQALGELDEGDAVEPLIVLLDDEQQGLREAALWSLRKISGLNLAPERGMWEAWYERESKWMDIERPRLRAALNSRDLVQAIDALRAYSERQLFRSQLAEDVIDIVDRPEAGLQQLACETLQHLGSRAAVGPLVELLASDRPPVAEAAWQALRTLTGQDVPRNSAEARKLLASS